MLRWTDPEAECDREAIAEIREAQRALIRWRFALEDEKWPGRTVSSYPAPRERILDGT